ncbi:proton-coupled amino acid transporter-like protein CG1139 isoform X2 [Sitodiplosis mosellana]|uniref:proton-coupled amino acid transporter-like protein CG1139 isoform X2 n=1 Tax=Sitodiplosis mosellana TaxID=263140 RepID=UPI0024446BEB|nr:proton-coupled amino acid transporter-like protein CG1139 isoform X2 [Sitodiplosis mosellana]
MNSKGHVNLTYVNDSGKHTTGIKNVKEEDLYSIDLSDKIQKVENYDPYLHRTVEHPLSNTETIIHLLKSSLGTGILAMPQAIYHAGWLLGSIGTVAIGLIAVYSMQILLSSHYELCKRRKVPSMDYPAIAQNALLEGPQWLHRYASLVVHITNGFLWTYQIGSCCIYVVFIGGNIKSIVDYFTQADNDIRLFMLMILLPIIFINWVRNLKYLAPFSTLANSVTVISFAVIFYFIFREPIVLEGRRPVGPLSEIPFFIGTVLFSLESVGVIMPLENEMRTPRSYVGVTGVLSRAFAVIVILYIGMGLFGYLKYGDVIRESITLNLEINDQIDNILAQSVKAMLAFGIFITHGIACYVAIDITWNKYIVDRISNDRHKLLWEYVVRTVIVLITFLLAVAIPKLDLFISLFGAFCLSTLGLAFPALIETLVFLKEKSGTARTMMIIKNTIISIFGLCALIIGTSTSVLAIIESFTKK